VSKSTLLFDSPDNLCDGGEGQSSDVLLSDGWMGYGSAGEKERVPVRTELSAKNLRNGDC